MIRHGFHPEDMETGITSQWLAQTFATLIQQRQHLDTISETDWMEALQQTAKQIVFYNDDIPGRETLVDPTKNELPLIQIDPYVRGIVRWLNRCIFTPPTAATEREFARQRFIFSKTYPPSSSPSSGLALRHTFELERKKEK